MVSRNWLVAAALGLLGSGSPLTPPAPPAGPPRAQPAPRVSLALPAPLASSWRESSDHARLFTPRHVPAGSYHAYVSSLSLEAAVAQIKSDLSLSVWPDAWRIEALAAPDSFGQAAAYDRWTVARLYGGTPARIARGPRMDAG